MGERQMREKHRQIVLPVLEGKKRLLACRVDGDLLVDSSSLPTALPQDLNHSPESR
jgi:hypothetical protein